MTERKLRFESLLLPSGWAEDVCLSIDAAGVITGVEADSKSGDPISGTAVPGMANLHSHTHQRLMQGLAERAGLGPDSFWTWREVMYGFALKLSPEDLEAVAAQAFMEMLCAGFTSVGEFQYLHHQPDGTAYAKRAELSLRCVAAAEETGIGLTILPVYYAHGGFGGQAPTQGQRRFINSVDGFLEIHSELARSGCKLGIAPHSLRAVTKDGLKAVISATPSGQPVHIHVAEQLQEVADCLLWADKRPVHYLLDNFAVGKNWCAIHATHLVADEITGLAKSGAVAGLCPTTEANLGDGVFPARAFLDAGGAFGIGTDSHVSISVAEDLRMLEYSQRLSHHRRNTLADGPGESTGRSLFNRALKGGAQALQQNSGAIEIGRRADIVVLDLEHPSMLGRAKDQALDAWIFSTGNSAVRDVYVGGRLLVEQGRHINHDAIIQKFKAAQRRLA
jgi:formimidoylglutamate deiminase